MSRLSSYALLAVLIILSAGCTLEQKLAKTFISQEGFGDFYLLEPGDLFKYNLKEFEIPGIDTLDAYVKDSLLMAKSLFLQHISDSEIIEEFTSGLANGLESLGAKVLPENAVDTLMINGGTPHILNVAQFSLEEYIHPYSSEELVYDEIIVIDGIDLNAINFNVWLELGKLNTEKNNQVLFISDFLLDNIDGTLRQNLITGKMSFDFTIDTITIEQACDYSRQFGKATASYLFDYMMNNYIGENLPENYMYERIYYHYDPERRILFPVAEEERILELKNY